MKYSTFFITAALILTAACGGGSKSQNHTEQGRTPSKKLGMNSDSIIKTFGEGLFAQFLVTEGEIIVELEMTKAPLTVANFVALAEGDMPNNAKSKGEPFYNDLTFHRVISRVNGDDNDFMIQGGDPEGNGSGGPGYSFRDEFSPTLTHAVSGILSMANSGPGTNGSQFFITLTPTPHLNNKHSVFGHVVKGQDVVNRTLQGDKMFEVNIIRSGEAAKAFKALETFNALK
jgi:peptidyl-prolyl cis-trans isomerase A (cyclophilin A)